MALFYLRSKTETLTLWIDAICINQLDTSERNHQVAQMGTIYSNAVEVIVWLGMPTEESYAAFDLLRSLTSSPRTAVRRHMQKLQDPWQHLRGICQRTYWKRLWIIQEVVRAARITVQCGTATIDWESLCTGLEMAADPEHLRDETSSNEPKWLLSLKQQRKGYHQNGCRIVSLLESCTDSECLDPRDMVFGLLGLADDCGDVLLADYSKSTADVFNDVVAFYYNQSLEEEASESTCSDWKAPGLVKFAHLMHRLLLQDVDDRPEEMSSKTSVDFPDMFHFTGTFRGNISAVGPALSHTQQSPVVQNRLISAWFNIVRTRKRQGRGPVHEALKNGLGSALQLSPSQSADRVRSINRQRSYAIIG